MSNRSDTASTPMVLVDMHVRDPADVLLNYVPGSVSMLPGLTTNFARSTAAYQTDAAGHLVSIPSNTWRDGHYLNGVRSLLLEKGATNLALWCRDLTNAAWTKTNATVAKDQVGMDNTANSASSFLATAANATVSQAITSAAAVRCFSVYVARITGTGAFQMSLDNGASGWTTLSIGPVGTFLRVVVPVALITNPTIAFRLVTNGDKVKLDFAQLETLGFAGPTSPILTTTLAVARGDDVLSFSTGASGLATPQELDVLIKFVDLGTQPAGATVFSLGDGAAPSFFLRGSASALTYEATHRRATDAVSSVTTIAAIGDVIELRARLSATGSVLLGTSQNGKGEVLGSQTSDLPLYNAWDTAFAYINSNGTTPGYIALQSLVIYPALKTLHFGTEQGYTTKKTDQTNTNILTNGRNLSASPWTVGPNTTILDNQVVVAGVPLSKITFGAPVAGNGAKLAAPNVPSQYTGSHRVSWKVKHGGFTGDDITYVTSSNGGGSPTDFAVETTFHADGTVTFNLFLFAIAAALTVVPYGPGEYGVFVDFTTSFIPTIVLHASDPTTNGITYPTSYYFGDFKWEEVAAPAQVYRGRVKNAGVLTLDLISAWAKGVAPYGIGTLQFNNTDGALDAWHTYAFDGYAFEVYVGVLDVYQNLTKTLVFAGVMEQPDIELRTISLTTRTAVYKLDKPVLSQVFAGTGGVEGDASVQGVAKQRVSGYAQGVSPILVDALNSNYFFADRTVVPSNLYDIGVALTFVTGPGGHGEFANIAAMNAASWGALPSGGFMFAWQGGVTYLRLQSPPAGTLVGFGVDSFIVNPTLIESLLTQYLTDAQVTPTAVVCDGSYPLGPVGGYPDSTIGANFGDTITTTDLTFADAIGRLLASAAGWMWLNTVSNVWVWGQFPSPAALAGGQAVCVVNQSDIIALKLLGNPKTPGSGVPPWLVQFNFEQKIVPQTSLSTSVSGALRAWFGAARQIRSAGDPGVKQIYPLAEIVQVDAPCLTDKTPVPVNISAAAPFAAGYFAALTQGCQFFSLTVGVRAKFLQQYATPIGSPSYLWVPATMPTFRGAMLGVKSNRLGFTLAGNGTKCGVLSVSLDLVRRQITFLIYTTFQPG